MKRGATLEGYFGKRNAGDDAFCFVAANVLPRQLGLNDLVLVAEDSQLPALPSVARGALPATSRFPGHVRAATIGAKLRHRMVLHVGGSTFRRMNRRRRDEVLLQRSGLVACHAVAVSVGPFRTVADEREIREFLKRFRSISLRDIGSYQRTDAMSLDVPVLQSFDPAVLVPNFAPREIKESVRARPRFGVALRLFESHEGMADLGPEETRFRSVVELLKALADVVEFELVVLALNAHPLRGDVELAGRLADELRDVVPTSVIAYNGDVASMYSAVSRCDAVLAMRLHAAVFAYTAGVPFALIDYHPKCAEFGEAVRLPSEFLFAGDGSDLVSGRACVVSLLNGTAPSLLPVNDARALALEAFDLLDSSLKV